MQSMRTIQPSPENPGCWELVDRKANTVSVFLTRAVAKEELRKRERLERDPHRSHLLNQQ